MYASNDHPRRGRWRNLGLIARRVAMLLAILFLCGTSITAVSNTLAVAQRPNSCDTQSYYVAHYQQCDNAYPHYAFYYWWYHGNYQSFVEDDPVHPQYHPANYYDSPEYYQSEYYQSGKAFQGDGPNAVEYTGGRTEYGGGGSDPGGRSGENGDFGSDGGSDAGQGPAPGFDGGGGGGEGGGGEGGGGGE